MANIDNSPMAMHEARAYVNEVMAASCVQVCNDSKSEESRPSNSTNSFRNTDDRKRRPSSSPGREFDSKKQKSMNSQSVRFESDPPAPNFDMYSAMISLTQNVQQLSSDIRNVSRRLEERITNLETNFETNLTEKVSNKISNMMEEKLSEKVDEIKADVRNELTEMQTKISSLEKSYADLKENVNKGEKSLKNNIVIKNIQEDVREKNDTNVTLNKVNALMRDGLVLNDIEIRSVSRKESRGRHPGVIVAEIGSEEQKREVMRKKGSLRGNRMYSNVYIENDIPVEARTYQANMRTVLKELGKENQYTFKGPRLVMKK